MVNKKYGKNKCVDCGKGIKIGHLYCGECNFQHGEVFTLSLTTWKWTKHDRGA